MDEQESPRTQFVQGNPANLYDHALGLLRQALSNPDAAFRDGQWEAIEALLRGERLLVVQRTGWGKSSVYFLLTHLLRNRGAGPTLIISPLLALMRNQIRSAEPFGIKAATIHSDNEAEWAEVKQSLLANHVDILLISPERLSNSTFRQDFLPAIAQGVRFLVVDEAHCTSYWGHDFRPDYQRIPQILPELPHDVRILATTATANEQVASDIRRQFGNQLKIQVGPLTRASLALQNIPLPDPVAKMAWLSRNLPALRKRGTGIVYVLTVRTADRIAAWLRACGIQAEAYTAQIDSEERKQQLEEQLLNNDLDVLVATNALGMGFDKPDLAFVVHFQIPGSVVHYYQQVGRAGRTVNEAYGILLSSPDDDEVNDFFIENALPPASAIESLLAILNSSPAEGHTVPSLEARVNLAQGRIKHALKLLSVEAPPAVAKKDKAWRRTGHAYSIQDYRTKEERLQQLRWREQEQMREYLESRGCLMKFLADALQGPETPPCGRCAPCRGEALFETAVHDDQELLRAQQFIREQAADLVIEPRKKWPSNNPCESYTWASGKIPLTERAEAGRALCVWNDPGWGRQVAQGYEQSAYAPELAAALADLIRSWKPAPSPEWVTCVPSSARPGSNQNLSAELAHELGLPFFDCIRKVRAVPPQREMANSWHRVHNRDSVYEVILPQGISGPLLLIDDVVDTGWTFTVVAALLRRAGSGPVFPLALAHRR